MLKRMKYNLYGLIFISHVISSGLAGLKISSKMLCPKITGGGRGSKNPILGNYRADPSFPSLPSSDHINQNIFGQYFFYIKNIQLGS